MDRTDAEQLWNIWAPASASTFISLRSYNKQEKFGLDGDPTFLQKMLHHFVDKRQLYESHSWKSIYITVMASENVYLYYATDSESELEEGDDNSK